MSKVIRGLKFARPMPRSSRSGNGQNDCDNRARLAVPRSTTSRNGRTSVSLKSILRMSARPGSNGQSPIEAQATSAKRPRISLHDEIAHVARKYRAIQKFRIMNGNQIGDLTRRKFSGAWMLALQAVLSEVKREEQNAEKHLTRLVKQHPMYPWIKRTRGLGPVLFGRLIGYTGPLIGSCGPACAPHHHRGHFPTVSSLSKFLGLHVDDDGRAPKRRAGMRAGWSCEGRTVAYLIGESIIKAKGADCSFYKRKRDEYLARPRLGPSGCPFEQTHSGYERRRDPTSRWNRKTGAARTLQCVKRDKRGKETSAHVHAAARRYMVKKVLAKMWGEWRRHVISESQEVRAPLNTRRGSTIARLKAITPMSALPSS